MYWDLKTVKPLPNFRIYVEIENGRTGIFDLTPYLDHSVFPKLQERPAPKVTRAPELLAA